MLSAQGDCPYPRSPLVVRALGRHRRNGLRVFQPTRASVSAVRREQCQMFEAGQRRQFRQAADIAVLRPLTFGHSWITHEVTTIRRPLLDGWFYAVTGSGWRCGYRELSDREDHSVSSPSLIHYGIGLGGLSQGSFLDSRAHAGLDGEFHRFLDVARGGLGGAG